VAKHVLLDAGPLGMISHPRPNKQIAEWLKRLLSCGGRVLVPEIADYEVRRELLRAGKNRGVQRLDALIHSVGYVPITTAAMLKAAEFWAAARNAGHATANVGHLARFADARRWDLISENDVT
jgi:predicted nucleic acid-binding protein